MRIADIKPLAEDASEPFIVRMIRRALNKNGKIAIDFWARSGHKEGTIDRMPEKSSWRSIETGDTVPTYKFTVARKKGRGNITFNLQASTVDDVMTFTKEDGKLKVVNTSKKVNEMQVPGEAPLWVKLIKNGLAKQHKFYFASGANQIYDAVVSPTSIRLLMTNRKTGKGKAYTLVPDNFEEWTLSRFEDGHRLTMKQDIKEAPRFTRSAEKFWILYDKTTTKLRESEDDTPMVVRLINQRTSKMGAVAVDVTFQGGQRLKGWITKPTVLSLDGLTHKAIVKRASNGLEVPLFLGVGTDEKYTMRTGKDGNGNTVVKVVDREAE